MICVLDTPQPGELCERMSVRARGWVLLSPEQRATLAGIQIRVDGRTVAQTTRLLLRPDVAAAHQLPPDTRSGFDFFFALPDTCPGATVALEVCVDAIDGTSTCLQRREVSVSRHDYSVGHFVPLLQPGETDILNRSHIYTAGPSAPEPSAECLTLLRERLDPVDSPRVLDVGCGIGAYAGPLTRAGFAWTGVESDQDCCRVLREKGLLHKSSDGISLPFEDDSFDAAICIEVLEHAGDVLAMLSEIKRVARQGIISVPNCELIPYYAPHLVVPWHLLEASHVRFFSRWTLQSLLSRFFRSVEICAYGPAPVRSIEGAQLYYHLLAHVSR